MFQQERDQASSYWNDPSHDPGIEFIDRSDFPLLLYLSVQRHLFHGLGWLFQPHSGGKNWPGWKPPSLARRLNEPGPEILLGHLPLYSVAVGRNQPGEVMDNADQLRAMLEGYNVHTYISGHHHAYYPGHRGKLQLLHTGLLGSGPRPLIDSDLPPRKALTVVDIDFEDLDLTTYTTYDMQTLRPIEV